MRDLTSAQSSLNAVAELRWIIRADYPSSHGQARRIHNLGASLSLDLPQATPSSALPFAAAVRPSHSPTLSSPPPPPPPSPNPNPRHPPRLPPHLGPPPPNSYLYLHPIHAHPYLDTALIPPRRRSRIYQKAELEPTCPASRIQLPVLFTEDQPSQRAGLQLQ